MATRHARTGIAHPTAVPENFDPDDSDGDDERAMSDGDESSTSDSDELSTSVGERRER